LRPSTGWHAQFEDVTNSGLVDLFVAKGNVAEMKDFASKDPNNLLMQRADGTFVEEGDKAGIVSFAQARGAALADFNLSGAIDILVVNRNAPAQLWLNDTPALGTWVGLQASQEGPNRNAIGGWIEVRVGERVQRRELTVGGGHASGQLTWVHFGLGESQNAEARVIWPDGTADDWRPVEADGFYWVRRGEGPVRWTPSSG
jgi:enediyne biosynthesis protein E4